MTHAFCAVPMATWWPVPLDRVHAIRPGDRVPVGDRTLRAPAPPLYDNPMSLGFIDEATGSLFSVDSFGAILPEPTEDAGAVPHDALADGMRAWATADSPWAHDLDRARFATALDRVRHPAPERVLSSHLPSASGLSLERFLEVLHGVPDAEPAVPPSREEFSRMLAALAGPPVPALAG